MEEKKNEALTEITCPFKIMREEFIGFTIKCFCVCT